MRVDGTTIVLAGHPVPKGGRYVAASAIAADALRGLDGIGRIVETDATDETAIVKAACSARDAPVIVVPVLMNRGAVFDTVRHAFASAGHPDARLLRPVGTARALADVALAMAGTACDRQGWRAERVRVLAVGHGAADDTRAQGTVLGHARRMARHGPFARVEPAFLEAEPRFGQVLAQRRGKVIVVAFFLGRGRHVAEDIEAVINAAGPRAVYAGSVGDEPALGAIIRRTVRRALTRRLPRTNPAPAPRATPTGDAQARGRRGT